MLNKEDIQGLVREKDLIENYPHLDTQLQPNGFDITVDKIFRFSEKGKLDFSNSERELPDCDKIKPEKKNEEDKYGWWELEEGAYKVRTNERVNLPKDLAALGFPRSSLLRMGALVQQAVWDAGYSGRGEFILVVENEEGVEIKENARVAQLVFFPVKEVKEGYGGVYGE
ncbi:MAG: deoxyuridine 5'-triphosphate nucleotidohydrolase [Candidatus Aenigmatarchaeota archaeon]